MHLKRLPASGKWDYPFGISGQATLAGDFANRLRQGPGALLQVGFGRDERRRNLDCRPNRGDYHTVLARAQRDLLDGVVLKRSPRGFVGGEIDGLPEAAAPDLTHYRVIPEGCLHFVLPAPRKRVRTFDEPVTLHDFNHLQSDGARDRVSAVRVNMPEMRYAVGDLIAGYDGPDGRVTGSHRLRHVHYVRFNPDLFGGEPRAGTAKSGNDFVYDQKDPVLVAKLANLGPVAGQRYLNAIGLLKGLAYEGRLWESPDSG